MATDEQMHKWRNALRWAAIGFVAYGLIMLAATAFLHHGGLPAALKSPGTGTILSLALLAATVLTGLGQRNLPVSLRNFRNLLFWSMASLAIFALVMWSLGAFAGQASLNAMNVSATIALWVGLVLFFLATVGLLHVAVARTRIRLVTAEHREAILERVRALSYSLIAVAAMGLMLVVLSLAGPVGPLPRGTALVCVVLLLSIRLALRFATRPLLDELSRTISRETGCGAFYLIVVIGGGWAILAQLRFVTAPAPLDWVTMFTVMMFAASFIVAGRRGLLKSH